jgi:predicted GNAT family acetyltransferase
LEKWAKNQQDVFCFENGIYQGGRAFYGEEFIEQKIHEVIAHYKKQPFAWWVGPSCDPVWLGAILQKMHLKKSTAEHAMICDLEQFDVAESNVAITIDQVATAAQLEHFIQVLEIYDVSARIFYEKLLKHLKYSNKKLFVAYDGAVPVVIASLYIDYESESAGIFNVITAENKRGIGHGTKMMNHLMWCAKKMNMKYATLLASSDSGYRIYERLGFKTLGQFECFEWEN